MRHKYTCKTMSVSVKECNVGCSQENTQWQMAQSQNWPHAIKQWHYASDCHLWNLRKKQKYILRSFYQVTVWPQWNMQRWYIHIDEQEYLLILILDACMEKNDKHSWSVQTSLKFSTHISAQSYTRCAID